MKPPPQATIALPDELKQIAELARPHYQALAAHRLH
jgi:hypothetical protein